jgi:hypothetical protein
MSSSLETRIKGDGKVQKECRDSHTAYKEYQGSSTKACFDFLSGEAGPCDIPGSSSGRMSTNLSNR